MTRILSIDPGTDGAAALFNGLTLVDVLPFKSDSWEQDLLDLCVSTKPDYVVKEKVGARRGDGRKGLFTFGAHTGAENAILKLAKVKVVLVRDQDWPLQLALPKRRDVIDPRVRRQVRRQDQQAMALELWGDRFGDLKGDWYAAALIGFSHQLKAAGHRPGVVPGVGIFG